MGEVDADLMGSSGDGFAAVDAQKDVAELDDLLACDARFGGFSFFALDAEFLNFSGKFANGCIDDPRGVRRLVVFVDVGKKIANGDVGFLNRMILKLSR